MTRTIDGSDRDQLTAEIKLETCFKGDRPAASEVRVIGYDVVATKDISQGYAYAGAPTGFISKGRNLLFLRRTDMPNAFEVTVPIYQTAIHLADNRPNSARKKSQGSERHILTQEFEAALLQFDDRDLSDINYPPRLARNSGRNYRTVQILAGHAAPSSARHRCSPSVT